jgi:hypothetical protein
MRQILRSIQYSGPEIQSYLTRDIRLSLGFAAFFFECCTDRVPHFIFAFEPGSKMHGLRNSGDSCSISLRARCELCTPHFMWRILSLENQWIASMRASRLNVHLQFRALSLTVLTTSISLPENCWQPFHPLNGWLVIQNFYSDQVENADTLGNQQVDEIKCFLAMGHAIRRQAHGLFRE